MRRVLLIGSNAATTTGATATSLGKDRSSPRRRTQSAPTVIENNGGGKRHGSIVSSWRIATRVDRDNEKILPDALASDDDRDVRWSSSTPTC
mmetsp:Transcript_10437/g.22607  ORF Transcript_10437/g.22607 Transcript_10437/m.22607 type:complete len:92 (+) Transcript_10437:386-661(+)